MPCTVTPLKSCIISLCLIYLATPVASELMTSQKYHHHLTIKYFTQASMVCDHPDLNVTLLRDVRSLSWMLPDGTIVDASSALDSRLYFISGPDTLSEPAFSAYNLTALNVDDASFGYYTCLVVYNTQGRLPTAVRWGLNVDGADFSDLLETYKTNAIIGGCAAAAMLLLVGGGCLIWNVRNGQRNAEEEDEDKADVNMANVVGPKVQGLDQNNHAYVSDIEATTSIDNYSEVVKHNVNIKM
uniref:Ig-like domain-containing protein n=1 Tax=Biomphalaria glabrata TaxID=6526 RepID=A0A2C9K8N9_BIOGL